MSIRSAASVLAAVLLAAALASCSRHVAHDTTMPDGAAPIAQASPAPRNASLAVERRLELDVGADRVAPLFEATLAACAADAADDCVVLESNLSTGDAVNARLKLRASAAGVAKLAKPLRTGGGVVSETATAEDLAAPLADNDRKLAMLRDYRDSLLALRARGGNNIDALIRTNQELAQVQSQLEATAGEQAHLQRRVATETLTVVIDSAREGALWNPVAQSLHEFGGNLSTAAASVVTFVAFLVPWLVILVPLAWLARRLWTRWRRPRPTA